jgi:spermidine/putrescine transport system permease protein
MVKRTLKWVLIIFVLIFLYAPIVTLVVYSFNAGKSMGHWAGFSFAWYGQLFADSTIMDSLWVTLSVATIASVCATILGTFAAVGIHAMRRKRAVAVENITYLPMLAPDIVTGISLMLLFIFAGFQLGYGTMVLAHITFDLPYVIFSVLPKLRQVPQSQYEAAIDLGAKPHAALYRVIFPQILPGILTGLVFAFTLSIDDFVISYFASQNVSNLSMTIYSMARRGLNPKINALSTLMFATILVLLIIINVRNSMQLKRRELR